MSAIKQIFKGKKPKDTQVIESFDQSCLEINVSHGKTQLTQVRLTSNWLNGSNAKLPQLSCKWFNKTENNIEQIVDVTGEVYQPCLSDVGSILHVQIVPYLVGVEYVGMPIIKEIGPIVLAQETEEDTNELLAVGKATFFVEIKKSNFRKGKYDSKEGLVRISRRVLSLHKYQHGELSEEVTQQVLIGQAFPQLQLDRRNSKEVFITFNEEESCHLQMGNNKVRDTFCLLHKLLTLQSIGIEGTGLTLEEQQKQPLEASLNDQLLVKGALNLQETKEANMSTIQVKSSQSIGSAQQKTEGNLMKLVKGQSTMQSQVEEFDTDNPLKHSITDKTVKLSSPESPLRSHDQTLRSPDQSLRSPQQMFKSSLDSPQKQSASDLLSVCELRKQIKRLQQENQRGKKELQELKVQCELSERKYQQTAQRMQSLNRNYLELEKQCQAEQKDKDVSGEILSYHRKEAELLRQDTLAYIKEIKVLKSTIQLLEARLRKYDRSDGTCGLSYDELLENNRQIEAEVSKLSLKMQYCQEEKDRVDEQLRQARLLYEQIEAENKHLLRKYESLFSDIQNGNSPTKTKSIQLPESPQQLHDQCAKVQQERQNEILCLKRQIKQLFDQNDYLRSLLVKDKKPSSRNHLKLELLDVKKLANKLSETITDKDVAIEQLRIINKQLNAQITAMNGSS